MNDKVFMKENQRERTECFYSKDKKYSVEVLFYKMGDPKGLYWNYSRGIVKDEKSNTILFDIKRNHNLFWLLFVSHPNNISEYPVNKYVKFFCWINVEFNKSLQQLTVGGYYKKSPFEYVTFDFSDPTIIPLPEISRRYADDKMAQL